MTTPLTEPQVEIRGTQFQIRKMLPEEALEVLETIRVGIGETYDMEAAQAVAKSAADRIVAGGPIAESAAAGAAEAAERSALFVRFALRLPRETLREVRRAMFRSIWYSNTKTEKPLRVGDSASSAFEGLDPMHVYELTVRAFVVNFSESLGVFQSLLPEESPDTPSLARAT